MLTTEQVREIHLPDNHSRWAQQVLSLKELQSKGLIDGTLAEWATALRVAGNQGAHYTCEPVPRDDAEDALAFAEALLDHVYVLRKRFEAFKKRLDK